MVDREIPSGFTRCPHPGNSENNTRLRPLAQIGALPPPKPRRTGPKHPAGAPKAPRTPKNHPVTPATPATQTPRPRQGPGRRAPGPAPNPHPNTAPHCKRAPAPGCPARTRHPAPGQDKAPADTPPSPTTPTAGTPGTRGRCGPHGMPAGKDPAGPRAAGPVKGKRPPQRAGAAGRPPEARQEPRTRPGSAPIPHNPHHRHRPGAARAPRAAGPLKQKGPGLGPGLKGKGPQRVRGQVFSGHGHKAGGGLNAEGPPGAWPGGPSSNNGPAVTYSPTPSRVQYHRRCGS